MKAGCLETALQTLGLAKTGESSEPVYDPGIYAVTMPDTWLVVMGAGWPFMDVVQPEHARVLSMSTEALHFYCDDTPMCASLRAYRAGRELWSLEYDGSNGASNPVVFGEAPPAVADALQSCMTAQRNDGDVDHMYEAAPKVGLKLVGFRHDQTLADGGHTPTSILEVAKTAVQSKQSWIRRLFGISK